MIKVNWKRGERLLKGFLLNWSKIIFIRLIIIEKEREKKRWIKQMFTHFKLRLLLSVGFPLNLVEKHLVNRLCLKIIIIIITTNRFAVK